jgi:hypothetical protein
LSYQAYDPKSDPNLEQLNDLYENVWHLLRSDIFFITNVPICIEVVGMNHFRSVFFKEIVELTR